MGHQRTKSARAGNMTVHTTSTPGPHLEYTFALYGRRLYRNHLVEIPRPGWFGFDLPQSAPDVVDRD